jgi:hypothetical protein
VSTVTGTVDTRPIVEFFVVSCSSARDVWSQRCVEYVWQKIIKKQCEE